MTEAPICKKSGCGKRVTSRVDRGPRKGQWRDHCSRACGLSNVRRRQPPEVTLRSSRIANNEKSRQARVRALRQVFGTLLEDRNQRIGIQEAARLALRYGQLQREAGYKAALQRYARERATP